LMYAAQDGHTATVNALAGTHNANVEAVNQNGTTALMLAAEFGHTATVNALAGTHNANVEAVNHYGSTALMHIHII
jgi:ankyrin repeat protein